MKRKPEFEIVISDGFCAYKFPLRIGSDNSIQDVYEALCNHFGIEPEDGYLVSHVSVTEALKMSSGRE